MTRTGAIALTAAVGLAWSAPARALPTMIRLGYVNCAACHISPQGGGPLNSYGRAIDEAQSLRSAEYRPSENRLVKLLSARGLIQQDLRAVFADQRSWAGHQPGTAVFRPRLMYRNVTDLGKGFRLSGIVTGETKFLPRPSLRYDPPASPSTFVVNTALVHYRASKTLEFAAGRDQLPTGVNVPDLGVFIKSRNRYGYYDSPVQAKASWENKRYQVMPFAYAPAGNQPDAGRESGAGTLAEFDLLGKGKTVVGVSLLRGTSVSGTRQMVGAYTRVGFGRWGILAEHDVTDRTRDSMTPAFGSFRQQASYAQIFWAMREWLVASAIGERLRVEQPFAEQLTAGKLEIAARLTNQASIGLTARAQHNELARIWGKSVAVQLAVKTAQ